MSVLHNAKRRADATIGSLASRARTHTHKRPVAAADNWPANDDDAHRKSCADICSPVACAEVSGAARSQFTYGSLARAPRMHLSMIFGLRARRSPLAHCVRDPRNVRARARARKTLAPFSQRPLSPLALPLPLPLQRSRPPLHCLRARAPTIDNRSGRRLSSLLLYFTRLHCCSCAFESQRASEFILLF